MRTFLNKWVVPVNKFFASPWLAKGKEEELQTNLRARKKGEPLCCYLQREGQFRTALQIYDGFFACSDTKATPKNYFLSFFFLLTIKNLPFLQAQFTRCRCWHGHLGCDPNASSEWDSTAFFQNETGHSWQQVTQWSQWQLCFFVRSRWTDKAEQFIVTNAKINSTHARKWVSDAPVHSSRLCTMQKWTYMWGTTSSSKQQKCVKRQGKDVWRTIWHALHFYYILARQIFSYRFAQSSLWHVSLTTHVRCFWVYTKMRKEEKKK